MTVLVIGGTLLSVSQYFARLFGFLEAILRILVVRIAVGVILHCKAAIGLLDLYFGRRLRYIASLVVVTFGHALISQTLEPRYPTGAAYAGTQRGSLCSEPVGIETTLRSFAVF